MIFVLQYLCTLVLPFQPQIQLTIKLGEKNIYILPAYLFVPLLLVVFVPPLVKTLEICAKVVLSEILKHEFNYYKFFFVNVRYL